MEYMVRGEEEEIKISGAGETHRVQRGEESCGDEAHTLGEGVSCPLECEQEGNGK